MNNRRIQRAAGLGLMLAVVVVFVTAIRAAEKQRTPDWQTALAQVWSADPVIEAVRAQQPEAFAPATTYTIHDDGQFITLPEAPREVYCVVVRHNTRRQLVFVNYYTDNLWRAGWVVMDDGALPADEDTQQQLDALGCPLAQPG